MISATRIPRPTPPPGRADGPVRGGRDAAQAAGRLDHEVADLPVECDARCHQRRATRRISRTRSFGCCRPRCCSTRSARSWACPNDSHARRARLRAAQLPGASGGVAFLKTFGKPDRLLTCECERSESTTLAQAFQMINGETVRQQAGDEARTGSAKCLDAGRERCRDPE